MFFWYESWPCESSSTEQSFRFHQILGAQIPKQSWWFEIVPFSLDCQCYSLSSMNHQTCFCPYLYEILIYLCKSALQKCLPRFLLYGKAMIRTSSYSSHVCSVYSAEVGNTNTKPIHVPVKIHLLQRRCCTVFELALLHRILIDSIKINRPKPIGKIIFKPRGTNPQ